MELFVFGFPPFVEDGGEHAGRASSYVRGSDDEVVGVSVFELGVAVGVDADVLVVPFVEEAAYGLLDKERQVTGDISCVLACDFYFTGEGEVVTAENTGACDDARWEGFVVAVSQSQHPTIVGVGGSAFYFHETEVAHAFVTEAVGLGADGEPVGFEGLFDTLD